MDLLKSVKRVLSIQELRQAEYNKLRRCCKQSPIIQVTWKMEVDCVSDMNIPIQFVNPAEVELNNTLLREQCNNLQPLLLVYFDDGDLKQVIMGREKLIKEEEKIDNRDRNYAESLLSNRRKKRQSEVISSMNLLKSVKRVLSIQELRQAEYNKLRSVHGNYTSHTVSLSDYQKAMAEITTAFQSLSRETIQLSVVIRDHSLPQAAQVLDRIQAVEKVKLTLTAEWQVLVTVEIGDEEFDQAEHTHKQKTLRQKLARVEGEIAELVQDFRYECEHILVSAMDHIS